MTRASLLRLSKLSPEETVNLLQGLKRGSYIKYTPKGNRKIIELTRKAFDAIQEFEARSQRTLESKEKGEDRE
jgi:hypothetical protein